MYLIEIIRKYLKSLHPVTVALFGYLSYILFGWILLCLPIVQSSFVPALDNLFVATSAVSTTGLSTISIADCYNFGGELVVMILIQLGGIGYMTLGSFVILTRKKEISPERAEISSTVFSLPKNFRIDKFIRSVVSFTFFIELLGAIALYFIFCSAGVAQPVWSAVFHSVSSFCTAGFGLYNNSFESFQNNFWLNAVVSILSYFGAIGFIVFVDLWRKLKGKIEHITLTSKIIIQTTFWLSLGGVLVIYLSEPTIQQLPPDERLMASFFQTMAAISTVGFNSIPMSQISKATMLVLTILMIIGASPAGTGGGLKSTTFSAMIGVMKSAIRGDSKVTFWQQEIPFERIWTAVASLCFYILFLILGILLLTMTETSTFEQIVFESASALGTVGLSMGITSALTNLGKVIVILLMFIGRVGPLSFGIALFLKRVTFFNDDERDLAI